QEEEVREISPEPGGDGSRGLSMNPPRATEVRAPRESRGEPSCGTGERSGQSPEQKDG
ncbi:hypothetical protein NDU88_005091, partial [Pleurodeles waltl]